jgi:hypothetical protein
LDWGNGAKEAIRYIPGENGNQMFQYDSQRTSQKIWVQIAMRYGCEDYRGKVRSTYKRHLEALLTVLFIAFDR